MRPIARRIAVVLFVLLPLLSSPGGAAVVEEGMGIIYGSDHAFSLKAPKGWMLDNENAVNQGLHAVFYPKGENWKDSRIVAYARARPRTNAIDSAEAAAKAVVEDFRANGNPKYQAKRIKTLKTDSGRDAVIYHFSGDRWGNSEAAAYFVETKTINFLVMNSREPKLFAESLDEFEALAKSYVYLGDGPVANGAPAAKVEELPGDEYEKVEARARDMGATEEGKNYEKNFSGAIKEPLQGALRECAKDAKTPFKLSMVFEIKADGTLERIVTAPDQPVSLCAAKKVAAVKLPVPPKAGWMVLLNVAIN